MILPVCEQRAKQVGTPQNGRIRRRFTTEDDVVATAGAGVASINHEFLRAESRLSRFFVEECRVLHELVPRFARMQVHLDHAGVWRDFEHAETRVERRCVALDDDGHFELFRCVFDGGDEFEVFLQQRHRRHENVELSSACFDAKCGADDPRCGLAGQRDACRVGHQRDFAGVLFTQSLRRCGGFACGGRTRRGTAHDALAKLFALRQWCALGGGIEFNDVRIILRAHPRQRVERQS